MYLLVSIVHVIVCLILILVILLQAGKGGGLSEMFGGAMTQNEKLFGAETNNFLKMATSYAAIIFIITCILLGILTANQGRSLVESRRVQPVMNGDAAQSAPATTETTGTPAAMTGDRPQAAPAVEAAPADPKATAVTTTVGTGAAVTPAATEPAPASAPAAAPAQETAPAAAQ